MKKLFKVFPKIIFPFALISLSLFVVFKNVPFNSWLTGWDNLHPEFNILVNLKRSFFAAWQEYQGLGLVGGMGHAADTVRQGLMYLLLFFVPQSLIRSILVSSSLIIGPLGVYVLVSSLLKEKNHLTQKISAFLGGAFYLLNLGTVLNFWVIFEPYYWVYASLPWLVWALVKYLQNGTKRYLLTLFVINILATPMAYLQTIFVVYGILAGLIILGNLFTKTRSKFKGKFKNSFVSFFIIFAANAFWFLPVVYFTLNNASVTVESHANRIATEEVNLSNKDYGNIKDIVLLKGYWLSYYDYNSENNNFDYLVAPWRDYLNDKNTELLGFAAFGVVLLGMTYSFLGKIPYKSPLALTLLMGFFMLLGSNPPVGEIYDKLTGILPLISQIFRSPYTKWVVTLSFLYSVFFAFGVAFVIQIFSKIKFGWLPSLVVGGVCFYAIIFYMKPIVNGNLIYPAIKRQIPSDYKKVFDFFKNESKARRIAFLPVQTFWGWNFYDWGARGSGFLWYGIEQPILDRAFDVWSRENETFYNEVNYTLFSENPELLKKVLEKYQVSYLLLDENVIDPGRPRDILYIDKFKEFAKQLGWEERAVFGDVKVFETSQAFGENFVFSPGSYKKIDSDSTYSIIDPVYLRDGIYLNDKQGETYPFANFDPRKGLSISFEGEKVVIKSNYLEFTNNKFLSVPEWEGEEKQPEVYLNEDKSVSVVLEIPNEERVFENFTENSGFPEAYNCDIKKQGIVTKQKTENGFLYEARDNGISCDFLNYGEPDYQKEYLLRIKGENKNGRSMKFYFLNWLNQNIEMQELLPNGTFDKTFFIPSKNFEGSGYALNLETRSFGQIESLNFIEQVEFVPLPYEWLTNIKLIPEGDVLIQSDLKIEQADKFGTSHYFVQTSGSGLLALNQGYDEGWKAFAIQNSKFSILNWAAKTFPWFFGEELEHVKVNSWENGWRLDNSQCSIKNSQIEFGDSLRNENCELIIIYWPQYLEWGGLFLIVVTGALIAFGFKQKKV